MPVDGMVAAVKDLRHRSHWQLYYQATSSSVRTKGVSEGKGRAALFFEMRTADQRDSRIGTLWSGVEAT